MSAAGEDAIRSFLTSLKSSKDGSIIDPLGIPIQNQTINHRYPAISINVILADMKLLVSKKKLKIIYIIY